MENIQEKICPICGTEIKEGEASVICPNCNTEHHEHCWTEKNGCVNGCGVKNIKNTANSYICKNCGEKLNDDQAFCPKCGAAKVIVTETIKIASVCQNCGEKLTDEQVFCPKCGAAKVIVTETTKIASVCQNCGEKLTDEQVFCPKCGAKVQTMAIEPSVINNEFVHDQIAPAKPTKKIGKSVIIGVVIGLVIIAVVVGFFVIRSLTDPRINFKKEYAHIEIKSWCQIGEDGNWMKIDTNPEDIDSDLLVIFYNDVTEALNMVKQVNLDLGFTTALYEKMENTVALNGTQKESNEYYTVTWSYHPDHGLEVMYEIND